MKIDRIVVGCYKGDFWLARICIASIRYWYPHIRVSILKDVAAGDFDTAEVEECWDVDVFDVPYQSFGSPVSKLETFFREPQERLLFLDADIIMVGKLVEELESYDEDLVVSSEIREDPTDPFVTSKYYDYHAVMKMDPDFDFPKYVFNTGQFVVTTNRIKRSDFQEFVSYSGTKCHRSIPSFFRLEDQGIINYVIPKLVAKGQISIAHEPFKIFGGRDTFDEVQLSAIRQGLGIPKIVHYAGPKPILARSFIRGELMQFFEDYYYSRVPNGTLKRLMRIPSRAGDWSKKSFRRWLLSIIPGNTKEQLKRMLGR